MAERPPGTSSKGPEAFRTISEASAELGVPQHVLRFWETKFSFIRPMKRAGGRRYYRRQDLDVLRGVRSLLHEEGYTIKGVQRLHREQGLRRLSGAGLEQAPDTSSFDAGSSIAAAPNPPAAQPRLAFKPVLDDDARSRLQGVLDDLDGAKAGIDALLREGSHS